MENTITLISGQKIDILMQDEVSLDIDCSLRYIESGKKEIEEYVEDISKKRLDTVVEDAKAEMKKQIDDGVLKAQEEASISAKEVIDENISSMKTEIENYINNEIKPDIEADKNDAAQSAQTASQAALTVTEAYNNLNSSLELAQEVASGNIGDIKYTLRTSAPHGGVLCNGQMLHQEQYPDLYDMVILGRLKSVSLAEYESQVINTGSCKFFTIDESLNAVRVPLIQQDADSAYKAYVVCYTGKDTEIDITQEITLNNPYTLFDSKYTEALLYNASWLLSNGTFYSGDVYVTAFEALQVEANSSIAVGTASILPSGSSYTKRGLSVKTTNYSDYDFVISGNSFRLPIKNNLASGKAVVGNGMTLGLTNGSQSAGLTNANIQYGTHLSANLNAFGSNIGTSSTSLGTPIMTSNSFVGLTTDPLKSGIETSCDNLYLYYYVGETVQNANLIDVSRITEQLSSKLSRDNKEEIISWGMPDYSAGIAIASLPYTAPTDGVVDIMCGINNSSAYIKINDVQFSVIDSNAAISAQKRFAVKKNDIISIGSPFNGAFLTEYRGAISAFYPFKGAN